LHERVYWSGGVDIGTLLPQLILITLAPFCTNNIRLL
jgi:hypothetical protein